jgi:hypothetical protein
MDLPVSHRRLVGELRGDAQFAMGYTQRRGIVNGLTANNGVAPNELRRSKRISAVYAGAQPAKNVRIAKNERPACSSHAGGWRIHVCLLYWTVLSSNPLSCGSLFSFREIVVTSVSVEDFPQVGVHF